MLRWRRPSRALIRKRYHGLFARCTSAATSFPLALSTLACSMTSGDSLSLHISPSSLAVPPSSYSVPPLFFFLSSSSFSRPVCSSERLFPLPHPSLFSRLSPLLSRSPRLIPTSSVGLQSPLQWVFVISTPSCDVRNLAACPFPVSTSALEMVSE